MNQETEPKTRLTVNDPVSPEDLKHLAELQGRRYEIADALLDLEQEKVSLLVQARTIDTQRTDLFTKIVTVRGFPAGFPVEIDAKSGCVKPLAPQGPNGAVEKAPIDVPGEAPTDP